jgi:Xaa-Pro aminopeptidase
MDGGAEVPSGYAADVTRTWPTSGRFSTAQRSVYDIVLRAVRVATEMVRPGVRYRDIHFRAAAVIAEGLAELGLMKGDPARAVERGAHAAFFPHGVGHLLGLDVHDLESFGDRVLYGPGRERSSDFGTKYLRIDLDLEAGMVVTIEPGLYFVPAILRGENFRKKFGDIVDFDRAERFLEANAGRGFGGVRIEDDVLVTDDDPDVLTAGIPSAAEDVEAAVGRRARREVGVRT